MRKILSGACLSALALSLGACSGGGANTATTTNIEEMGPEGGSNITNTPPASADTAPVGSADNGNVAPGDANPNRPREGSDGGATNSQ